MPQESPDVLNDVPRPKVTTTIGTMMADADVKFIAVEFDRRENDVDLFTVSVWENDPR